MAVGLTSMLRTPEQLRYAWSCTWHWSGIFTELSDLQLAKAMVLMVRVWVGREMVTRRSQLRKAPQPIVLTELSSNTTSVRFLQLAKAQEPMFLIPAPMRTLRTLSFFLFQGESIFCVS